VTFTATVTPQSGSGETGTVQFQIDRSNAGSPLPLIGNTATYSIAASALGIGGHSIVAVYSGDGNFFGSTSQTFTQTAAKAITGTAVASNNSSSSYGQAVTFTATVTPQSGSSETGSVQFQVDGGNVGSPVPLNGNIAVYTTSTIRAGYNSVAAIYSGDNNFAGSSQSVEQYVTRTATTTAVTSSNNSVANWQPVTFTATISPNVGVGPTGSVEFEIDGNFPVFSYLSAGGNTASYTTTLSAGSHSIVAIYSSDANFAASTSPTFIQSVVKTATTTTVISFSNPSPYGQSVTCWASVTPASGYNYTGTIQFQIDGGNAGSPTSVNFPYFFTSALKAGSHSIVAVYSGDSNFAGSTSAVITQCVNQVATATKITSNNPSAVYGQSITFTATVTPSAGVGPTGTMQFQLDGSNAGGPVSLSGNTATYTTSGLTAGSHTIAAIYSGDSNFLNSGSPAFVQNVGQAMPLLAWSTPAAIAYGTALTDTQLNTSANVPGSYCYDPPLGAVLNAGTQALNATFTPTDTLDYAIATASVNVTVNPVPLSIATNAEYLMLDPDGQHVDVWNNSTATATPDHCVPCCDICGVTYTGPGGGDTFVLDYSNGDPLPAGGISLTGGAGENMLEIVGGPANDADAVAIAGGSFTIPANTPGAGAMNYTLGTVSVAAGASLALAPSDSPSPVRLWPVRTPSPAVRWAMATGPKTRSPSRPGMLK
jgi:hypothetical protein